MIHAAAVSPWQRLRIQMQGAGIDPAHWHDVEDDSLFVAALSQSGLIHPSGLGTIQLAAGDLSEEDLSVAVRASRGMHNADSWVRGDLMVYIRNTHYNGGDIPREDMGRWAKEFGTSIKRLLNNMTTSSAWELAHRYPSSVLSNSHHEILNALPQAERVMWAERAIAENLGTAALRTLLREDALSITPVVDTEGNVVGEEPAFASEEFDLPYAMTVIASWVSHEMMMGASVTAAVTKVLAEFETNGLIRFPARAWNEAMPLTAEEEE